jgi:Brp/Blh family beta-carotene 15,15'-monooxygenase
VSILGSRLRPELIRKAPIETFLFSGFAVVAIIVFGLGVATPPLSAQIIVLAILAAVLGLPHGALDPLIARRAGLWKTAPGFALFNLGYLAVVVAVAGIWIVAPGPSLIAFLLVSGAHFGSDWNADRPFWLRALVGIGLLSLPAFAHQEEVGGLYETLAPGAGAAIASVQATIAPLLLAAMLVAAVLALRSRRLHESVELVLAALLALAAPALIFFAIYFCALHSARHLREGFRAERGGGRFAVFITVVYTVVPIVAVGALLALGAPAGVALDAQVLQLVFIGLAGLTVPHMILVSYAGAKERRLARP